LNTIDKDDTSDEDQVRLKELQLLYRRLEANFRKRA